MKIIPENIPDQVVNDVIYHDNGVDYAIDSKGSISPQIETSKLAKEVVSKNKLEVFKHLKKNKIKLNYSDLIFVSCQFGYMEMTTEIMDSKKVKADKVTKYGWTPVEIAAINGHYEIVKTLVQQYKANVNLMNPNTNLTPLENAIEGGHFDTVKGMREELKAEFSSFTREIQDLEKSANVVTIQGELINPGNEHEKILKYLQEADDLPQWTEKRLSTKFSKKPISII